MADPRLVCPTWRDGRTNVDALTIACIEHAEQIVRDRWPAIAHEFVCTQGSYQGSDGDPDSGTTHRLGGAVDLRWCGHWQCYLALRLAGMFIWHRTPDQGDWVDHFHGAPLDHPYMDARLAAQEKSYLASGNGIGGADDGPRLNPIPRPVWPWPQEDDVTPEDINKIADAVLAKKIEVRRPGSDKKERLEVEQVLRETFQRAERVDEAGIARKVEAALADRTSVDGVVIDVPLDEIKDLVKQALREGTGG